MMPGPIKVIICPKCGMLYKLRTLLSGNTFGATVWSDGKQVAPMLPEYPEYNSCRNCGELFNVNDAEELMSLDSRLPEDKKTRDIPYVSFPEYMQLIRLLDMPGDKLSQRLRLLYCYNDYYRDGRQDQITPEMQRLHEENIFELSGLLDENDKNDLILKAELYRNLGLFEKSAELLKKITEPHLLQVKVKFLLQHVSKNRKPFVLFGKE